ncbi:hypothetical protein AAG570_011921 [Ranatra chinensis]|uniref:Uncharacterized protein n=1 Tax=Ranatra chinensis TaxID=642074 RepID=A0ABD0Z5M0_9HEMI
MGVPTYSYNCPKHYCDHPQSLKLKVASKRRNIFYQNKKQETTGIAMFVASASAEMLNAARSLPSDLLDEKKSSLRAPGYLPHMGRPEVCYSVGRHGIRGKFGPCGAALSRRDTKNKKLFPKEGNSWPKNNPRVVFYRHDLKKKVMLAIALPSSGTQSWAIAPEEREWKYRLSMYYTKHQDSGVFTCATPRGLTNSINLVVTGK